ncbi:MAG: rhodanese-related sulfurtransferase [Cryomorphaceae bacterium]|nr:rhodanese-related sulfurtransferase [Cryomorphaceae bacterium]
MDPNAHKKGLVNRLGRRELQNKLDAETFSRKTISFYRYVRIEYPNQMRDYLFALWNNLDCLGRIYLAKEGINAQMNVPEHHYDQFLEELYNIEEFRDIPIKVAVEDDGKSFLKLTVKVRHKIVADGLDDGTFDVSNVGNHLTAEAWNELLETGKATVVDMRNHYESEIGHFEGATCPQSETFREELPEVLEMLKGKEEEPIMLYCTGGIRCEKASAWLRHHGFKNVNQLHGGIIDYHRQVVEKGIRNTFKGKNFVFDDRLGERISNDVIAHCHQCETTCDTHVNCKNPDCNLLFIQCPSCHEKYEGCCSEACQKAMQLPEEKRRELFREKNRRLFQRFRSKNAPQT